MRRSELRFDRPDDRQAVSPPELRGLDRDDVRLMVSDGDAHEHARFRDLHRFLEPGSVLVVNESATLAASLPAVGRIGAFVLNLATDYGGGVWLAEPRWSSAAPGPLPLQPGEVVQAAGLQVRIVSPYPGLPRLWFVEAEGDLRDAMRRSGSPIRYGYLREPYPPLAMYQTIFAARPGSAEMPSAARPFTPRVLESLSSRGVAIVPIVLHAGVSSLEVETDAVEDQPLPPEPFEVPIRTARAVNTARHERRPVVAVGTTVVRALESAWDGQSVRPVIGFTRLLVHPGRPVRTVDALITGFHDPLASHLAMLYAVTDPERVRSAYSEAVREGYLWHEFGDSHLIKRAPAAGQHASAGEEKST